MKSLLNILFVYLFLTLNIFASSRSDVKIIESTENIRYLGQKISKEYLYLYHNPKRIELKAKILNNVDRLELAIDTIDMSTMNTDSKNILDFLMYNKNEIKDILTQEVNRESAMLMLDYSESFLEGANSIADAHRYKFSEEEKRLMSMKELEYLLERVSKYYIATKLNLDKTNNFENMINGILKIDTIIKEINDYTYPKEFIEQREHMNGMWDVQKEFLYKIEKIFIPHLLESSSKNLEEVIEKLALYHKKNQ